MSDLETERRRREAREKSIEGHVLKLEERKLRELRDKTWRVVLPDVATLQALDEALHDRFPTILTLGLDQCRLAVLTRVDRIMFPSSSGPGRQDVVYFIEGWVAGRGLTSAEIENP